MKTLSFDNKKLNRYTTKTFANATFRSLKRRFFQNRKNA